MVERITQVGDDNGKKEKSFFFGGERREKNKHWAARIDEGSQKEAFFFFFDASLSLPSLSLLLLFILTEALPPLLFPVCLSNQTLSIVINKKNYLSHLISSHHKTDEPQAQKMTLVADLKTFPDTVEPALPLQIQCLTLVQAHYPERMGRAVVGHAPAMFWLMWKAVTPFIDPVTKAKVAFCTTDAGVRAETAAHIGMDQLYETLGGSRPDHELDVAGGEARLRGLEAARRAQLEATAREMGLEGWQSKLAPWVGKKEGEEVEVEAKKEASAAAAAAPSLLPPASDPEKSSSGLLSKLSFSVYAAAQREN